MTVDLGEYGAMVLSDGDMNRLKAGRPVTLNLWPPDEAMSHDAHELYFDDVEQARKLQEHMDEQILEQGEKAREYVNERRGSEYAVPEAFWRKVEEDRRKGYWPEVKRGYASHVNEAVVQEMFERQAKREPKYNYPKEGFEPVEAEFDPVDRPSHYTEGREIEPIDVIDDWDLDFYEGQVLKYIARRKKKGRQLEDTKKAKFYMDRLVAIEEENCND